MTDLEFHRICDRAVEEAEERPDDCHTGIIIREQRLTVPGIGGQSVTIFRDGAVWIDGQQAGHCPKDELERARWLMDHEHEHRGEP